MASSCWPTPRNSETASPARFPPSLRTISKRPALSTERTAAFGLMARRRRMTAGHSVCRISSATCVLTRTGATSASAAPSIRWPGDILNGPQSVQAHPDDKYGWAARWVDISIFLGRRRYSIGAKFRLTRRARSDTRPKPAAGRSLNGSSARRGLGVGWDLRWSGTSGLPANTEIHLTNAWSVNAGYEHFWNPRWRTSLYGGYTRGVVRRSDYERHQQPPAGRCGHRSVRCPGRWRGVAADNLNQAPAATAVARTSRSIRSARAPSGTSPRTSTWAWTSPTRI